MDSFFDLTQEVDSQLEELCSRLESIESGSISHHDISWSKEKDLASLSSAVSTLQTSFNTCTRPTSFRLVKAASEAIQDLQIQIDATHALLIQLSLVPERVPALDELDDHAKRVLSAYDLDPHPPSHVPQRDHSGSVSTPTKSQGIMENGSGGHIAGSKRHLHTNEYDQALTPISTQKSNSRIAALKDVDEHKMIPSSPTLEDFGLSKLSMKILGRSGMKPTFFSRESVESSRTTQSQTMSQSMSSPATPELRSTMSVNYHRAPEHTLFHGLIAPLSPQEYNELGAHHPYESLADFNEALSELNDLAAENRLLQSNDEGSGDFDLSEAKRALRIDNDETVKSFLSQLMACHRLKSSATDSSRFIIL